MLIMAKRECGVVGVHELHWSSKVLRELESLKRIPGPDPGYPDICFFTLFTRHSQLILDSTAGRMSHVLPTVVS